MEQADPGDENRGERWLRGVTEILLYEGADGQL